VVTEKIIPSQTSFTHSSIDVTSALQFRAHDSSLESELRQSRLRLPPEVALTTGGRAARRLRDIPPFLIRVNSSSKNCAPETEART
jgi:hypothetical protein